MNRRVNEIYITNAQIKSYSNLHHYWINHLKELLLNVDAYREGRRVTASTCVDPCAAIDKHESRRAPIYIILALTSTDLHYSILDEHWSTHEERHRSAMSTEPKVISSFWFSWAMFDDCRPMAKLMIKVICFPIPRHQVPTLKRIMYVLLVRLGCEFGIIFWER